MSGEDIPGRRKSKCKGPEVRVWEKQQKDCCSWRGGREEERRKVRAERVWGQIVPGLVGHGEDIAFTLSELGATGGL